MDFNKNFPGIFNFTVGILDNKRGETYWIIQCSLLKKYQLKVAKGVYLDTFSVAPYKVFRKIIPSLNMKYLFHLSWKVYGIGLENCQCNFHHKRQSSSKTLFKTFSALTFYKAACKHYLYVSEGDLSHEQSRSTFMSMVAWQW